MYLMQTSQIIEAGTGKNMETTLVEVGPRFVLNVIRIFNGSFNGSTLYENPHYRSPNEVDAHTLCNIFPITICIAFLMF